MSTFNSHKSIRKVNHSRRMLLLGMQRRIGPERISLGDEQAVDLPSLGVFNWVADHIQSLRNAIIQAQHLVDGATAFPTIF